ncbi:hypothetical protein AG1IA_10449 [Rhizoctonia solani AG-1 IA]|uniref:Uncharacterized protein n=1 Tax=Thanatephorus cucumeris (strain AG1-IA) TaxID=983506 RepID=L8WBH2_THACA|nr:hypothetical protein AG1IA_10449 [Rhizoctonia solani AG-1 IA]
MIFGELKDLLVALNRCEEGTEGTKGRDEYELKESGKTSPDDTTDLSQMVRGAGFVLLTRLPLPSNCSTYSYLQDLPDARHR